MDTKAKKRYEVLKQKLQKLKQQLAGAKQQPDDIDELKRLEKEVADVSAEIEKLKNS